MGSRKLPGSGLAFNWPKFGLASILEKSECVAKAFGPRLGFVLMVIGILARASIPIATVIAIGGRSFLQ